MTNLIVLEVDIAKPLDTVSHDISLKKLELYDFKGVTLDWFLLYLSNRQQQRAVEGCVSEPRLISCEVPQGSILGPLLLLRIFLGVLCISRYLLDDVH